MGGHHSPHSFYHLNITPAVPFHSMIARFGIQNSNSPISSILLDMSSLNLATSLEFFGCLTPTYPAHTGPIPVTWDISSVRVRPQHLQIPALSFVSLAFNLKALLEIVITSVTSTKIGWKSI